ncbi:hypothetical protein [Paragemmobacter ruber]|uniref:Uncharacterized protein n=1 Tax=Paragemmobacter ruber TaxID=1985673 RepID=A0ABW9Y8A1_9RHOB|nr:hypothetical protein [Rhodobacter ruber]NBE08306.1 hypothetical protein [Rhodobacter ruber]
MALALVLAPAIDAVKHGPGALAAEADHRAAHAAHGHAHDLAGSHHHDSSDHDHVAAALLGPQETDVPSPPARMLRPAALAADGMIRDVRRRPPRLTVI